MKRKVYFIIFDGGADRPIKLLGGKTPFEYANTPMLDFLAKNGSQSLISIMDSDIAAESDSGCMALLSYDPLKYYKGRGPLEALGAGLIREDCYCSAFRVNFSSYEDGKLERRTARGLTNNELQLLTDTINNNVSLLDYYNTSFRLISYRNHRGIVTFYNDRVPLSGNVTYTDPGFERKGYFGLNVRDYIPIPRKCEPLDSSDAAFNTAEIINRFVHRSNIALENHKVNIERRQQGKLAANYLLVRDGGELPSKMEKFYNKFGLTLSIYGQLSAEKALADIIGASFAYSRQLEDEPDDLFFSNVIQCLIDDSSDIVFAHMKGPDEPGHDNQPMNKVRAIESLDNNFLAKLLTQINEEDIVIVTCDHATPCELMLHSNDKVPLVIYGRNIPCDSVCKFGEIYARQGQLPIKKADHVIDYIVSMM